MDEEKIQNQITTEDATSSDKRKQERSTKTSSALPHKKTTKPRKPSSEDNGEWDALYQYVRNELFRYPNNLPLTKYCIARLRGLAQNNFVGQVKTSENKIYGYVNVLKTAQVCHDDIVWAFDHITFNGENHKVNYMIKILENKITDVALFYSKVNELSKNIEAQQQTVIQEITNDNEYTAIQHQSNSKKWRDKYKGMW